MNTARARRISFYSIISVGLIVAGFVASPFAHSRERQMPSCPERFRAILTGQRAVLSTSSVPRKLFTEALQHYVGELGGLKESVTVESAAIYKKAKNVLGYKVSITDGGDEALVDYFFDGDRELITAYWHSQSPQRFWFCDRN